MRDARVVRDAVLLALPVVAFVSMTAYFLAVGAPRLAAKERTRALAESKIMADSLRSGSIAPDFVWEYGKGVIQGDETLSAKYPADMAWKDWQPRDSRKSKMWGWREAEGGRTIWARTDKTLRAKFAPVEVADYISFFYTIGIIGSVLIVFSASLSIYHLISYAKSRTNLLVSAAHDLNTPLASLSLLTYGGDPVYKVLIERMQCIVRNLGEFVKPGAFVIRPEVFRLRDAYDEAYMIFAPYFRDRYGGKDIEIEDCGGVKVLADYQGVCQILWNILGNALKYAAYDGDVKARIAIDGDMARVDIADTGLGLTWLQKKLVFRRYYRSRRAIKERSTGFGIGLSVARRYATRMKGRIEVTDNKPRGCVFSVYLPLAMNEEVTL